MSDESTLSLPELEDRIAVLRDNIRQLVEQAAGSSGAQDEQRTAERIERQNEQLDKLIKARNALMKK
jgi:predicted transcriptional regulator